MSDFAYSSVDVGARIKARRKELGLTLQDLADVIRVARSTVQRYETANFSRMKMPVLYSIAQALEVNPDWLVGKSDLKTTEVNSPAPSAPAYNISAREYSMIRSYRKAEPADRQIIDNIIARYPVDEIPEAAPVDDKIIPLFGTAAAAGPGEMDTGLPWEDYAVPADSRADFAIRISGDSMEPVLRDGQIALCAEKTPQIGDVAVMQVNGCMLVKQFIRDSYGNLYLRSVNRDRSDNDVDVKASGNDTVLCFGTVLLPQRPALPID